MTKNDSQLGLLHRLSSYHRRAVLESSECGCFFCISRFDPKDIPDWADGGMTAHCPNCGIDSVLPGSVVPVDIAVLERMNERWFCEPVDRETAKQIDESVLGKNSGDATATSENSAGEGCAQGPSSPESEQDKHSKSVQKRLNVQQGKPLDHVPEKDHG